MTWFYSKFSSLCFFSLVFHWTFFVAMILPVVHQLSFCLHVFQSSKKIVFLWYSMASSDISLCCSCGQREFVSIDNTNLLITQIKVWNLTVCRRHHRGMNWVSIKRRISNILTLLRCAREWQEGQWNWSVLPFKFSIVTPVRFEQGALDL